MGNTSRPRFEQLQQPAPGMVGRCLSAVSTSRCSISSSKFSHWKSGRACDTAIIDPSHRSRSIYLNSSLATGGGRGKSAPGKEVAGCESLSRRKKLSQERSRRKISKTAHGSTVRASANTVDRSGNNWREWEEDERLRNRLLELIRVSIQHRSHQEPAPVPASQLEGRPSRYLAMLEDARARYGTDRISAGRDAQKSSIENESSV